ncbi:hypothetical protein [Roseimicrobium sp. ORNL1]|uniref:hypothetical protein n=1 Tax=Roseimicrobium sp. ORNL1 TaxID=2711231 RepID=UPI0013E0F2E8|nr:hypothetical protein [Roseimicrobium sp. ORNL1]QIF03453.1 hypothetical protein G5S37_18615 [Roseimicrobium sp. ORNL1]
MKMKCTLLLTAMAVGGTLSTAQAGPDLQIQEQRRNIAQRQEHTHTVTAGQGGAVTFTWVASSSGKGGTVISNPATTNVAVSKSRTK